MARVYSGQLVTISEDQFNVFLNQYLILGSNEKPDLVESVKKTWLQQLVSGKKNSSIEVDLPATQGQLKSIYPDGVGAYTIFAKHPVDCPNTWICFYVGISETGISGCVAKHHCEDARKIPRFHWLGECSETFSCFLNIENADIPRGSLELLEYCFTGELRPWMRAIVEDIHTKRAL